MVDDRLETIAERMSREVTERVEHPGSEMARTEAP
jgi:hypothetical protein